jgi:two-component system response regulator (stage 0 sporulation protein F)
VIDDDDQTRRMLLQVLARAGYEVREARDGHEGVQQYYAAPVDLIITDVLMPGPAGIEAISALRHTAAPVKIIAISGGGYLGNLTFLQVAEQAGACRTFQKPFELQELLDAIYQELEGTE